MKSSELNKSLFRNLNKIYSKNNVTYKSCLALRIFCNYKLVCTKKKKSNGFRLPILNLNNKTSSGFINFTQF